MSNNNNKSILQILKDVYHANYYLILSLSIIVIVGFIGTIFGFIDISSLNRFDINEIKELDGINYEAVLVEEGDESPYLVVSGDIKEDIDLITIQRELQHHRNVIADAYLVDDIDSFDIAFDYYTEGLRKHSSYTNENTQEVTTYEKMYMIDNDISAIDVWDITNGKYDNDTYVVEGIIEGNYHNADKHYFLVGMSEMLYDLNKENEKLDREKMLFEFIDGEDKVSFHTGHIDILGKKSLYEEK